MPEVAIVIPTLDADRGEAVAAHAQSTGGVDDCQLVVVEDVEGVGGCRTANVGFRQALEHRPKYVCYLNDDVAFPQAGWLARLVEGLGSYDDAAVAGPSGYCGTLPQRRGKPNMPRKVHIVKRLSFFCAVFRVSALEEIGLFDEVFYHWGCDSDWCMRANQAGWQCVWVQDVWVQHNSVPHNQRDPKLRRWKQHDVAEYRRRW